MANASEGYDPRKSRVSDETMELWTMSAVVSDIQSVPGIGPAAARKLADDSDGYGAIRNTYQLFGKWLELHDLTEDDDEPTSEPDPRLTNQKFWFWLKAKDIHSNRSAIVKAVSDKLGSYMTTLRPPPDDDDDDDESENEE